MSNDGTQTTVTTGEEQLFEWHPIDLIREYQDQDQLDQNDQVQNGPDGTTHQPGRFALVVLNQPLTHLGLIKRLWKNGVF